MANNFKIKKYWIITLCMVLCSLSSFSQELSDATIGFDVGKAMVSLKKHGVKDADLGPEVSRMREMQITRYNKAKQLKNAFLQNKKPKSSIQINNSKTARKSLASAQDIAKDKAALIALYNSTNGDSWKNTMNSEGAWPINDPTAVVTSWNPDTNTGWYGVVLDAEGRVSYLDLRDNNLTGEIPSQIGSLTKLTQALLYNNRLSGSIPAEIGQLKELFFLNLEVNQLSGSIPPQIGSLPKLQSLFLDFNQLTGTIPVEIAQLQELTYLSLGQNGLTGTIPSQLGSMPKLETLSLSGNQLTGTIPTELGQLTGLYYLDLASNQLSGTIPSQIKFLTKLEALYLSSNNLTGFIPIEIGKLTNLIVLYLDNNQLTGPIPSEIGFLTHLERLFLHYNQLSDAIPNEFGQCKALNIAWLSSNQLTGNIPSQIGLLTNLENFDLTDNQLSGVVPAEIGGCSSLIDFSAGVNQLTGPLPPQIGALKKLKTLYLYQNLINGTLPIEITQCEELSYLYLQNNQLTGSIPAEIGTLVKLQDLWLNSNEFSGPIPVELGQCKQMQRLFLDWNKLTGNIPSQLASLTKLNILRLDYNRLEGRIPDLTSLPLTELSFMGNKFRYTDFIISEYLKYSTALGKSKFSYAYQAKVDAPKTITKSVTESVTLKMYEDDIFTENEKYQWYRGPYYEEIKGATSRELTISNLKATDAGTYFCQSKHQQITVMQSMVEPKYYGRDLVLEREPITLEVLPGACTAITGDIIAPTTILNGNNIHFTFNTTSSQVLTYFWTCYNLDNNIVGNSTSNYIDNIYSAVGNYKVELKVKDENNCETTFTKIITVAKNCSNVVIGDIKPSLQDLITDTNTTFSFETSATNLSYNWIFYNSDNTVKDDTQTTALATQTYSAIGNYKVKLIVTRPDGCTTTFEKTYTLKAPMVCEYHDYRTGTIIIPYNYGDPIGIPINTATNLTFYKYYGPSNANLTYEWKLYNSNNILIDSKNTKNFPITLTAIGDYKVKVKLTDALGCSEFESNLKVRDLTTCVISPEERNGTIYSPANRDVVLENSESLFTFSPSGFYATNFIYKWDLIDANGNIVATSNEIDFKVHPTQGKYQVNLQIKDPNGCTTDYKRDIETVDICTYTGNDNYFDIRSAKEYMGGRVWFVKPGEISIFSPRFFDSNGNYTYSWKLYNPTGELISTGSNINFPVTLSLPGYHKITLDITNLTTGCTKSATKTVDCLISNSCTVDNSKSQEVKELYVNFVKKLIIRYILGETDEQINASIATPEFMALKPYIKNGTGDKIYNFVSSVNESGGYTFNFSFSPDRAYDVHVSSRYPIYYDPEYNSLEDLDNSAAGLIYTDISQYIAADDYFVSCYVQSEDKKKKTAKVVLGPNECTRESEVRNIIFCPGEGNNCTPSIVGAIKSGSENIYPNAQASFTFETTVPNLTYTWSVVSETGEVLHTSNSDITDPYIYTFATNGNYKIKLISKNETGCTENFTKNIIVDKKRCTSEANNFTFETAVTNATYVWTTTNSAGNIVDTVTNATGIYSFTTSIPGQYEVKLVANAGENCETIFAKTIVVENCNTTVSCTQNSLLTPKVHSLFINLINKLVTTPNGTDVNRYALNEIIALASYTTSSRAKIFNFVNNSTAVSFSFSQNGGSNDVFLPKSASGSISGIDLSKYFGSQESTQVITNYSDGSNNPAGGFVRNIDFCPAVECLPSPGKIKVTHATGANKSSTGNHSKI
ncbi:leucine-rich repeat domain-containing protein [Flavobacterium sp. ENC]|uniref:leucine-rich repeat domain-containing protein n=1 Tax=Flavobacterium sp. ENC TaxID=2897330 RepID=UPI001E5E71F6|nr:leucine-rich repeat domain-containing protein [Flavobacterium sp. ENC]MCD0467442.1 leucine-rich repeat domain-containing protein [Flavobacterium sp. ENC]